MSSSEIGKTGPQPDGAIPEPTSEELVKTGEANPQSALTPQEITRAQSDILPADDGQLTRIAQESSNNDYRDQLWQACWEHRPKLKSRIYSKLDVQKRALTNDIAFEAITRIMDSILRNPGKPEIKNIVAYLNRAADNLVSDVNSGRKFKGYDSVSYDDSTLNLSDNLVEAESIVRRLEIKEAVENALKDAKPVLKVIYDLYYVLGKTTHEISKDLGISEGMVRYRIKQLNSLLRPKVSPSS
ncbi:MAG: sigma-70 family RNA polymerase sigma factor [Pyrinomonadaceae bacterium]